MNHLALPAADADGLRASACRLAAAAERVESSGHAVSLAAARSVSGWSGAAALAMAARAREVDLAARSAADGLREVAAATVAYAERAEAAREQVASLNGRLAAARDAASDEQRRVDAMPPEQRVMFAGRDPMAAMRVLESSLRREHAETIERLRRDGTVLERAILATDPLRSLPEWLAGGLALGNGIVASRTLAVRGWSFGRWLSYARRASLTQNGSRAVDPLLVRAWQVRAAESLDAFRHGAVRPGAPLGGLRTVLGRVFLPSSVILGAVDAVTGAGHDGGRGVATRVLGAAGAVGAAGVLTLSNPVGLTVAGGAVLAYGAWSLGNLAWDNRKAVGSFLSRATGAVGSVVGKLAFW